MVLTSTDLASDRPIKATPPIASEATDDTPRGMQCYVISVLVAVYFVYVIVGGLIFMALENQNEIDTKSTNANFKLAWLGKSELFEYD